MIYIVGVMLLMYIFLYALKFRMCDKKTMFINTMLYFYVWLILFMTIIPLNFSINPNWQTVEPIKYPFENLKPYNDFILGRSGSIIDIVLNLLMMIPFAFFYSYTNENTNIIKITITTFLFSLFIESVQLVTTIFFVYGRTFDVTDIINNTIGGIIGYIIYKIFSYVKQ